MRQLQHQDEQVRQLTPQLRLNLGGGGSPPPPLHQRTRAGDWSMCGYYQRCAGLLAAFALLLVSAFAASAQSLEPQSFDAALEKFAADTYNDTDAAIAGVAASGNPLAVPIIEALHDGRLPSHPRHTKLHLPQPAD